MASKLEYFMNISGYTGPILQSFHHMNTLYVQMMDLYLIFQFVKGHCHATKQCCYNEGKLILHAFLARSPDGSTVLVCY